MQVMTKLYAKANPYKSVDLDGQTVDIDILDYDHIFKNSKENQSGLRVNVNPNTKHDEIDIVYTKTARKSNSIWLAW